MRSIEAATDGASHRREEAVSTAGCDVGFGITTLSWPNELDAPEGEEVHREREGSI
jgi:hypothetical protein